MQQLIIVHRGYSGEKLNEFIGRGRRAPTPGGLAYAGYYKRVRSPGSFQVGFNAQDERVLTIKPYHTFEFWLRDEFGGAEYDAWLAALPSYQRDPYRPGWYRDFTGLVLNEPEVTQASDGLYTSVIKGRGMNELLYSEVIDYASGTSQSDKSGAGETVAKEYVDENIGPNAGVDAAGYSRVRSGLTIEPDAGQGGTWVGSKSRKPLGDTLREIADVEDGPGDYMIIQTGDLSYQFQWKSPHWGLDRRLGNADGNAPMIFSSRRNNVERLTSTVSYLGSVSAVLVYGQGVGANQLYGSAYDTTLTDLTSFARKVRTKQARNASDSDELNDLANAELRKYWPDHDVKGTVIETIGSRYGLHWTVGILATVEDTQAGRQVDRKITGVRVSFERNTGYVSFKPEFGDFIDG